MGVVPKLAGLHDVSGLGGASSYPASCSTATTPRFCFRQRGGGLRCPRPCEAWRGKGTVGVVSVLNAEGDRESDIHCLWDVCRISTRSSPTTASPSGWRRREAGSLQPTPSCRHRGVVGAALVFPDAAGAVASYLGPPKWLHPSIY